MVEGGGNVNGSVRGKSENDQKGTESLNNNKIQSYSEESVNKTVENECFKRQITLIGAIGFLVGAIVGSGIFVSPSEVAKHTGSSGLILIVWTGSGVLALFSALCYVELNTMFPTSSGSDYSFVYEGFRELPAFISGFTSVVVLSPMSFFMVTLTCANYIVSATKIDEEYIKVIAAIIIGVIFILNCTSVKSGTSIQVIFTSIQLLALLMIALTGVVRLCQGHNQNFRHIFKGSKTNIAEICYAFYGGFLAYDGYSNLPAIAAELKNPIRDLPLSMWIGMILVTAFYITINIAHLTVITPS